MQALRQHISHLKRLSVKFGQELPGFAILKNLYKMMIKLQVKLEESDREGTPVGSMDAQSSSSCVIDMNKLDTEFTHKDSKKV